METITKNEIVNALKSYIERMGSQNKAANTLKGVSSATLSQMVNSNWELINDDMWRGVAAQIGYKADRWKPVETALYRSFSTILSDVQANSLVMAVTAEAGNGKTFTAKHYAANNKDVYMLCCNEFWNRKLFLQEMLTSMGRDYTGYTVGEMMHEVVYNLKRKETPLIILDEADKLTDQVLFFFITLYNQLEDECGIMMCATDHLTKRLQKGLKLNKKGYKEIWSRLGRKCVELKRCTAADIQLVCVANGVENEKMISTVIQDSESDLRRVKRKVHAINKTR
jgi:hypothetical protein